MRERTARGEATRQRILRAACELFHKQGYVATSPEQVIVASGTSKSQFYHYFKSKEGLIHAVLQDRLEGIKAGAGPFKYDVSSWDELQAWFLTQLELQRSLSMTRGCPLGTVGNEVTENEELIRQDLNLIFEVIKGKLARFFVEEKARKRIAKDADENRLAQFCIGSIQGALLMGKITRDKDAAAAIVSEALSHLRQYASARR